MAQRHILRLQGADIDTFLQDLVTNDLKGLADGLVYAALLTPQGKFLSDFFLARDGNDILMDLPHSTAEAMSKRLMMYRLRADVTIEDSGLNLRRGTGALPEGAFADPRHPELGWRAYADGPETDDGTDWDALRVAHCIPETGVELTPDTFILEAGFERLNGVDFHKGCYVGQEVTARMKHKIELRKGLATVSLDGVAAAGDEILSAAKPVGTLRTVAGDKAIAFLRFDRVSDDMRAGEARVTVDAA